MERNALHCGDQGEEAGGREVGAREVSMSSFPGSAVPRDNSIPSKANARCLNRLRIALVWPAGVPCGVEWCLSPSTNPEEQPGFSGVPIPQTVTWP